MSIKLGGDPNLHYGIVDNKPALPEGWRYIEEEGEWLKAQSPDGKIWFAGGLTLYRCRTVISSKSCGSLNPRDYVDSSESFSLEAA